jgi:enoyl-CoA hydratase
VKKSAQMDVEFKLSRSGGIVLLTLCSEDRVNRLTREKVEGLTQEITLLAASESPVSPLIISGEPIFSAGADLHEISRLNGPSAYDFAKMGQRFMMIVENHPAPVYAAIRGYCMGGGLDLALACHHRIAHPHAVFGHRGAALGLITGWGGTQRLPRLLGKARALQMFVAAEKVHAAEALRMGLIDAVAEDPVEEAIQRLRSV